MSQFRNIYNQTPKYPIVSYNLSHFPCLTPHFLGFIPLNVDDFKPEQIGDKAKKEIYFMDKTSDLSSPLLPLHFFKFSQTAKSYEQMGYFSSAIPLATKYFSCAKKQSLDM